MGSRHSNANTKIGTKTECPMCGYQFMASDTYGTVIIWTFHYLIIINNTYKFIC
jgi:hypothetical protein